MGTFRAWQCWVGRILQGLRALEAAAVHPLDLLSLDVWVIFACMGGCWFYCSCSHFFLGFLALAGARAVPTCLSAPWQSRWYLAPA